MDRITYHKDQTISVRFSEMELSTIRHALLMYAGKTESPLLADDMIQAYRWLADAHDRAPWREDTKAA